MFLPLSPSNAVSCSISCAVLFRSLAPSAANECPLSLLFYVFARSQRRGARDDAFNVGSAQQVRLSLAVCLGWLSQLFTYFCVDSASCHPRRSAVFSSWSFCVCLTHPDVCSIDKIRDRRRSVGRFAAQRLQSESASCTFAPAARALLCSLLSPVLVWVRQRLLVGAAVALRAATMRRCRSSRDHSLLAVLCPAFCAERSVLTSIRGRRLPTCVSMTTTKRPLPNLEARCELCCLCLTLPRGRQTEGNC